MDKIRKQVSFTDNAVVLPKQSPKKNGGCAQKFEKLLDELVVEDMSSLKTVEPYLYRKIKHNLRFWFMIKRNLP